MFVVKLKNKNLHDFQKNDQTTKKKMKKNAMINVKVFHTFNKHTLCDIYSK